MKDIVERIKREPALVIGFLTAVFALGASFGFELSNEQTGSIIAVVIAVMAFFVRQQVVPARAVEAYQTIQGETVSGPAAPPAGEPAVVLPVDTGLPIVGADDALDERGAFDTGVLVALACIVVILCGIVWLVQAL